MRFHAVADRLGLQGPVMEQPAYSRAYISRHIYLIHYLFNLFNLIECMFGTD
eukprot:COSAG06_NODE_21880_length_742_cov_0.945568_1_plen_52_part_00